MPSAFPFGTTRSCVTEDHALIGNDSHVTSPLPNWVNTNGVVLISPAMGAWPRAPRFVQYLAHVVPQSKTSQAARGVERLIYVLAGSIQIDDDKLTKDSFAWLPPDSTHRLVAESEAVLLVFEKTYVALDGVSIPKKIVGTLAKAPTAPFLGDPSAMLATLLPVESSYDMAVNVFTYQPGATLPFVESHVMEHGLYMRTGQGVYRLANQWYPVQEGDAIWMAAYCPQWFVAMGKAPASYIYYKDVHRDPMKA